MTVAGSPLFRRRPWAPFHRWGAVALIAGASQGCAAIAGLDTYSTGPEVADATIHSGHDAASAEAEPIVDASMSADAGGPTDANAQGDAEVQGDAEAEGDGEAQGDAETQGDAEAQETGSEASTPGADAQADAGTDASACGAETLCSGKCVDTTSDPSNCGGCANVCTPANVSHALCDSSACSYDTCAAGFGDCDGDRANGCEADLTEASHCGSCSTSCSSGLCGTSISGWTTSPSLWTHNGNTTLASGPFGASTAVLTTGTGSEAGTIIYAHPIVTDAFTATFTIYLGGGTSSGDGMGFMWQTQGATALGASGGCLAMCGLPGYGVEFDSYNNAECGDTNANHVAVDSLSGCSMPFPTHIMATDGGPPTIDNSSHAVVVTLASGAVSVTIDDVSRLSGVPLTGFVSGTPYYFGFAGATGGANDAHEVSPTLSITFPTPRCL